MAEGGKGPLPKESKVQRGAKQARMGPIQADKRAKAQIGAPSWTLAVVLDGAPFPTDASIKNF